METDLTSLIESRFGSILDVPEEVADVEPLAQIARQCSHRRFTERNVESNLLEILFACAFSAPSKSDLQQATVIRIEDPEKRAVIAGLIPSMPWIGSAPEFLLFCGDNHRIHRICECHDIGFANDHLDSFFNAAVDASLVLANFIAAAQAAGLGCCPVSAVRIHAERISQLVELPSYVFPVAGLALGYPVFGARITPRLALSVTVHVGPLRRQCL